MKNFNDIQNEATKYFTNRWIRWVHEGSTPANSTAEKTAHVLMGENSNHCAMCLNLNGCYFVVDKCPPKPLHPKCHCYTMDIPPITAKSECAIEKFSKYVFVPSNKNDKKQLFELWGYDIMDSQYLQQEFARQAKLAYSVGDYELGYLNEYGQRINITITLKRKNKNEDISFRSGWMTYPNGNIALTTTYGGKKK